MPRPLDRRVRLVVQEDDGTALFDGTIWARLEEAQTGGSILFEGKGGTGDVQLPVAWTRRYTIRYRQDVADSLAGLDGNLIGAPAPVTLYDWHRPIGRLIGFVMTEALEVIEGNRRRFQTLTVVHARSP